MSENYTAGHALDTARTMLSLGVPLLKAGGLAMKCESSGIAHSRVRWLRTLARRLILTAPRTA